MSVTMLVDGSALFFAVRKVSPATRLKYDILMQVLASENLQCDPVYNFTCMDRENESQEKFLKMLEKLGWKNIVQSPHESYIGQSRFDYTRFDATISYFLGRILQSEPTKKLVIITDSYSLYPAIKHAHSKGAEIYLCFFSNGLDPRWHKAIRDGIVGFLDLGQFPQLFNDNIQPKSKEDDWVLADLP